MSKEGIVKVRGKRVEVSRVMKSKYDSKGNESNPYHFYKKKKLIIIIIIL